MKTLTPLLLLTTVLIWVLTSCSGGASPINVSQSAGDSLGATLVVDSQGEVHLAWFDSSQGVYSIYYASKSSQKSWSAPAVVSRNQGYARSPVLAEDTHANLHLVWYDRSPGNEDVFYSMKPRGGEWSESQNLTNNPEDSSFPFIFVDQDDTVHLTWQQETEEGEDIFYMARPANGEWSKPVSVSHNPGNSRNPTLTNDQKGSLYLAWDDNVNGVSDIFFSTKLPQGAWSVPVDLSNSTGNSEFPRLVTASDGTMHLVWYDNSRGAWDILYETKTESGDWSGSRNLTLGRNGDSGFPRIDSDGKGNAYVVWNYRPAGEETKYVILYARSTKDGKWTTATAVSKSQADSGDPDIAIGEDGVPWVAWSDQIAGNWDIFAANLKK